MHFHLSFSAHDEHIKEMVSTTLERAGHTVTETQHRGTLSNHRAEIHAQARAVTRADAVVVLLSPDAIRDENMEMELNIALSANAQIWSVLISGSGTMQNFPLPHPLRGKSGVYCDLRENPYEVVILLSLCFIQTGTFLNDNSLAEIEWYSLALRIDPTNSRAYDLRGAVYGERGDREQAIADFSKAIDLNPEKPSIFANRARQYRLTKQYDLALADCDAALRLDSDHRMAYLIRGNVAIKLETFTDAIRDFDAALALDPDDAVTYANRGNAKHLKGDLEGALMDCTQALALGPTTWLAHLFRGQTYFERREYDRALADFEAVLQVVPNPDAHYGRSRIRYLRGDMVGAVADCKMVLTAEPDHAAAQRMRDFIQKAENESAQNT